MAITELKARKTLCPVDKKQVRLSDGNNLYLVIKTGGSKLWRFRYRYEGRQQELSLGSYPDVAIADAREIGRKYRGMLLEGINPSDQRKLNKQESASEEERSFKAIAFEWYETQKPGWTEDNAKKVKRWIDVFMKPLHGLQIDAIDAGHITELMIGIEKKGKAKSCAPILSVINRIYGRALAKRLTRTNPAAGFPLSDVLSPLPPVQHRAAITNPKELGALMRSIDSNEGGTYCSAQALKLIPRVFLRPIEVRTLKWEYVDFDDALIRIPAEDMKRNRDHLVPMSDQVIALLRDVYSVTAYSPYVFPNERNGFRPMSKNVLTNRLRALGYSSGVMDSHGFRTSASTLLHEQGWAHDVVESQLAHLVGTTTSRSYNRAKHLPDRKKMMQAWANYLDALKEGADVIAIKRKA